APAALASLANLASLAVKSALSSQIVGNAAVSPPVLELSGKSTGAFSPASAKVANTFFAASRLKGCLASSMSVATLLWSPFAFISALRAAIGSLCATNAVAPNASIATTSAVRIISCSLYGLISAPAARVGGHRVNSPVGFFIPGGRKAPNPPAFAELEIPPCLQRFRTETSNLNPADFEARVAACRRRLRLRTPNDHDSVNRATAGAGHSVCTRLPSAIAAH